MPASLDSNAIDAAILGEPLATINIDKGLVSILSNDFIDGFDATYLYMSEAMLADQATAQGFMRAYLKACADMQGDYMTPEIAAIVEKYTKVPAAVVEKAALPQYNATGTIPVADLAALQSYFRSRKLLEYDADIDIATIVNADLAASVAGK